MMHNGSACPFGVVNALLLRSIPFYQPDRLAQFQQFIPPHDSAKQFHEWRQHSRGLRPQFVAFA
jgi:hypothetical protein